jgi:hypothetical protein
MAQSITVTLPTDVEQALIEVTRQEGVRPEEVVGRAVKEHLFLRRFRLLRDRMVAKAEDRRVLTDQDVFDHVS